MAKIIIAEDEKIVAKDIANKLKKSGYEISGIVSTGYDLLNKVSENVPDLVLMDIKLDGDMDGIETAEELKRKYNVPVVFLTAYADKLTLSRIKETETSGYVLKPFKLAELTKNIETALNSSSRDLID